MLLRQHLSGYRQQQIILLSALASLPLGAMTAAEPAYIRQQQPQQFKLCSC